MIEVVINNTKFLVEKHLTVLQACEQANINVPRFCYHEQLSVAGNCRMCLVEIEKSPKPVASCAMPLTPGMVIFTDTPLVKKAREAVLEFLLINHPLDCPICDQAGECDLQDLTLNYGADRSRFFEVKHGVEDKNCGPIIKTIMTRCIHCTRCIRFLTEIAGLEIFGALGRGELMEIGPFFSKYVKTELSGNLVDLCPVGALTSKPYAFLARNWELKKIETVDILDAFGSNIVIHTRNNTTSKKNLQNKFLIKDQILRVVPKFQANLNEHWLSDKSRYALDGLFFNRTTQILVPTEFYQTGISVKKYLPINWSTDFLTFFLNKFSNEISLKNKDKNFFIGNIGKLLSIEEIYFFFKFFKKFGISNFLIENSVYNFKIDLPLFYQFNSTYSKIENTDLLCLIYTNPRFDSAMLNIKIRKQFFNKDLLIFYLGNFQEFTYPIIHLGQSLKNLIKIVEGKSKYNLFFRKAKNPLIILGSDVGMFVDSIHIQNLSLFFAKKCYLFLNNSINFNILHKVISQTHLLDLGYGLNAKNALYKNYQQSDLIKNAVFFNNNIENLKFKKNFCNLQSFNINASFNNSGIIIPINTVYEKDSILINSEGFIQKTFKSISPLANSKNSEDFLKAVLLLKNITNSKDLTFKTFLFEHPFLENISKKRKQFKMLKVLFNIPLIKVNFILQNKQMILKQFYNFDLISKNSKTMSECNLFYTQNSNFL